MPTNHIDIDLRSAEMTLREALLETVKAIEREGEPEGTFTTLETVKMIRNLLDIKWKDEV